MTFRFTIYVHGFTLLNQIIVVVLGNPTQHGDDMPLAFMNISCDFMQRFGFSFAKRIQKQLSIVQEQRVKRIDNERGGHEGFVTSFKNFTAY